MAGHCPIFSYKPLHIPGGQCPMCCISMFGVFINDWMFTDGYIAAIRNLGLARFRFVLYTLMEICEGSRHTFCFRVHDRGLAKPNI
jgi:hypothetical protein